MCSNVFRRRDPSEAWVASRAVEDLRTPARAPQRSDGPTCMLRDRPPKHTWSSFCDDENAGMPGHIKETRHLSEPPGRYLKPKLLLPLCPVVPILTLLSPRRCLQQWAVSKSGH